MPFSKGGGGVVLCFANLSDGGFVWIESDGVVGEKNPSDPNSWGIATCEERGAGGGADSGSDVEVGQFDSFFGEGVEVGCLPIGGPKAGEISVAHVVAKDDDDVGLFGNGNRGEEEGKKGEHSHDFCYHESGRGAMPALVWTLLSKECRFEGLSCFGWQ